MSWSLSGWASSANSVSCLLTLRKKHCTWSRQNPVRLPVETVTQRFTQWVWAPLSWHLLEPQGTLKIAPVFLVFHQLLMHVHEGIDNDQSPYLISWSKSLMFRVFELKNNRALEDLVLDLLSANLLYDFGKAPAPLRTSVSSSMKQKGWTE